MAVEMASANPAAEPAFWELTELTSSAQLRAEGTALQHCVASYGHLCWRGTSRIWSLRRRRGMGARSIVTIEVDTLRRTIVQAPGGFATGERRERSWELSRHGRREKGCVCRCDKAHTGALASRRSWRLGSVAAAQWPCSASSAPRRTGCPRLETRRHRRARPTRWCAARCSGWSSRTGRRRPRRWSWRIRGTTPRCRDGNGCTTDVRPSPRRCRRRSSSHQAESFSAGASAPNRS